MNDIPMLQPEELAFLGLCDLSAQIRGKAVPVSDLDHRLRNGVGYTPANICFSPFGSIGSSPFGTLGDIALLPDPSTKVRLHLPNASPLHLYLSDIATPTGEPWSLCPRFFLRRALGRLEKIAGCTLLASFEQEFVYTGLVPEPRRGYALASFREMADFGPLLVAALRSAGMTPEAFLPEFGPQQCEISVAPAIGIRAADEAVLLRELTRATAASLGHRAIFSPMLHPDGVGNGTHIHLSLRDHTGAPVLNDSTRPYGLSPLGEHFAAGILEHMPALTALTAPSVCSYYRLTPNRWAPTWAYIGSQDRAASLRICPGSPAQLNLEYRVADATANPYIALGALVHAGVDGIERRLPLPAPLESPFTAMSDSELHSRGIRPLPHTLSQALEQLRTDDAAADWLGPELLPLYLTYKREEEQLLAGLTYEEICNRYAAVY